MPAPSPTAPGTPAGILLEDGFSTRITFATNTTVSLWEKTVKPPGLDGGDKIEQTTMRNVALRTFASRALQTVTDMTTTAAYDPNVYNQLLALINVNTTVTVTFPDGSTLAFFGYLQKFEPNDVSEGEQPTATVTIVATNVDPASKTEQNLVLTSVAGT